MAITIMLMMKALPFLEMGGEKDGKGAWRGLEGVHRGVVKHSETCVYSIARPTTSIVYIQLTPPCFFSSPAFNPP